jgi:NAD(P)-dependent dehydrogenase (short-subunit alcohol dehydrogenase family)
MHEKPRVAVVAGASQGLGSAVCRSLGCRGYVVVALGRERALRTIAEQIPGLVTKTCDLTSASEVDRAFTEAEAIGPVHAVFYNAHRLELRSFRETPLDVFEAVWRVNCFGACLVSSRALPKMTERGSGSIVFCGATASLRGGKQTAAFASSKFALRGLAQSLAREFSPKGIHVAHVVLDGLVWSEQTRARFTPDEAKCMDPEDVAAVLVEIAEQRKSAWTHELDLRPWIEKF